MSANRASKVQQDLLYKLDDAFSSAKCFHLRHDALTSLVVENVFSDSKFKRAPRHVQAFLRGYWEAKRNEVYHHYLSWMLSVDGVLMSSKEVHDLSDIELENNIDKLVPNYRSPWARCDGEKSCHVWKDTNGNPLKDKPY